MMSGETDMTQSDIQFLSIQETQIEESIQQLQAQLADVRRERSEKEVKVPCEHTPSLSTPPPSHARIQSKIGGSVVLCLFGVDAFAV